MSTDYFIVAIEHDFEQPIPALQVAEALNEELGNDQEVGVCSDTVFFTVTPATDSSNHLEGVLLRPAEGEVTYPPPP